MGSSVVTTAIPGPDNPIGSVQELSQFRRVAPPQYFLQDASGESHCPSFTIQVVWCDLTATGVGTSKKEAKRLAAKYLLEQVSGEGGNSTSLIAVITLMVIETLRMWMIMLM